MAKKKVKKKLTEDEKEEIKMEGELPKKSVREHEDRQLIWFFVIVVIVFAAVLVPYFMVEGAKTFDFGGVEWTVENYAEPLGDIYHGRFMVLTNHNVLYNLYLRNDPRTNDVPIEGTLDKFKGGGVISVTPEFNLCRGDAANMQDLGGFMATAIGVGRMVPGSTDKIMAMDHGWRFATCETVLDRTLIIVDRGDARIVQDEKNPYCYTIYVDDCDDASPTEKFIIGTIADFSKMIEDRKNSEA